MGRDELSYGTSQVQSTPATVVAPLTVSEVLSRAADLIEPEGCWTRGAFARVAPGASSVPAHFAAAACWCLMGAVIHEAPATGGIQKRAYEYISSVLGKRHIDEWNDAPDRTQAEVVAALRKAAELALPADGFDHGNGSQKGKEG